MTIDDILRKPEEAPLTAETVAALCHEIRTLRHGVEAEGLGAMCYIAAIVHHFGGYVNLSLKELNAAPSLGLERAEQGDGSLIIRTVRDRPEGATLNDAKLIALRASAAPDLSLPPNG